MSAFLRLYRGRPAVRQPAVGGPELSRGSAGPRAGSRIVPRPWRCWQRKACRTPLRLSLGPVRRKSTTPNHNHSVRDLAGNQVVLQRGGSLFIFAGVAYVAGCTRLLDVATRRHAIRAFRWPALPQPVVDLSEMSWKLIKLRWGVGGGHEASKVIQKHRPKNGPLTCIRGCSMAETYSTTAGSRCSAEHQGGRVSRSPASACRGS